MLVFSTVIIKSIKDVEKQLKKSINGIQCDEFAMKFKEAGRSNHCNMLISHAFDDKLPFDGMDTSRYVILAILCEKLEVKADMKKYYDMLSTSQQQVIRPPKTVTVQNEWKEDWQQQSLGKLGSIRNTHYAVVGASGAGKSHFSHFFTNVFYKQEKDFNRRYHMFSLPFSTVRVAKYMKDEMDAVFCAIIYQYLIQIEPKQNGQNVLLNQVQGKQFLDTFVHEVCCNASYSLDFRAIVKDIKDEIFFYARNWKTIDICGRRF